MSEPGLEHGRRLCEDGGDPLNVLLSGSGAQCGLWKKSLPCLSRFSDDNH